MGEGEHMNQFQLSGQVTKVEPHNYKEDKWLYRVEITDEKGTEVPLTLFTEVQKGQEVTIEGRLGGWRADSGKLFLQTDYTEIKGASTAASAPAETTSAF